MAGVSQFACVQFYWFHSSFLILFFSYSEDYPRSQLLVNHGHILLLSLDEGAGMLMRHVIPCDQKCCQQP